MVDVVITYVDSNDKHWIDTYDKCVKNELDNVKNRFRSYGVLDLQIKLIRKYMKFVDKIFVVVSSESQVPDNVRSLENVHIVLHSQIIPRRYLPCFNSCTIEMYLYNIKKLSERFIYFNDDIFPINELKEEDFFVDGKIAIDFREVEYEEEFANAFQKNVINSTRLFNKKANKFLKPTHSCFPAIKSHIIEVVSHNINEIQKSLTRTRHSKNINFYAFVNYEIFTGNFIKMEQKLLFVDTENIEMKNIINSNILCLNDNYITNFEYYKCNVTNILNYILKDQIHNIISTKYISNKKINGISIIITAYKAKDFIKECLDSIYNNTFIKTNKNYEILIGIDNCIETLEYVKKIKNNYKHLKVFMMNSNKGTYVTSNTLIMNTKYELVIRFDSDDLMNENMIQTIWNKFNEDKSLSFLRYYFTNFDNNTKEILKTKISYGSVAYKKSIITYFGCYRPWICSADSELIRRITSFINYAVLDNSLFLRRIHENNLTVKEDTNMKSEIRKKYFDFIKNQKITELKDAILNEITLNTFEEII